MLNIPLSEATILKSESLEAPEEPMLNIVSGPPARAVMISLMISAPKAARRGDKRPKMIDAAMRLFLMFFGLRWRRFCRSSTLSARCRLAHFVKEYAIQTTTGRWSGREAPAESAP